MAGAGSTVIVVAQGAAAPVVVDATPVATHAGTVATGHETAHFPPFDATTFGSQLVWLAISFAALYLLMSRVALPRIGEILEVRRDRIEGDLAEADRLRQKTDQAIAAYEAALAEARRKARGIAEATRMELRREMEKSRREVEADLSTRVGAAEQSIQATKAEALTNVDEIAAQTAVAVVAAIAGTVSIQDARTAVAEVVKG